LGEAVCANQIENVRFLLEHGANVDLRSNQPIENDIESSSGGLTPLMEAADLLHLPIIALLLQYNASVTAVNDEQWTAVDMLRFALQRAITNDDIDNDGIIEAERLIEQMEQKQIAGK
jgi:ankyrin repeat protein